jgi:hypothetical protein
VGTGTINPTTCSAQAVTGELTSAQGTSAGVSAPFQATNCAALPFTPKLTTSTAGHPSRKDGIAFEVKLTQPAGQENLKSGEAGAAQADTHPPVDPAASLPGRSVQI